MKKTNEERVSTQNPVYAALDRKRRNEENSKLFSVSDQAAAVTFAAAVDFAFYRVNTYLNFNENNVVIKVNRPKGIDKLDPRVKDLHAMLEKYDISYKDLPNGNRIYELPYEPE